MLEYMDDVLGRLFEYLDGSAFKQDTYVMVMSDNGSEMFLGELPKSKVSNPPAAAAEPCMVPCRLSPDTHLLTCGCTMVTQRAAYAAAIASACAAALNLLDDRGIQLYSDSGTLGLEQHSFAAVTNSECFCLPRLYACCCCLAAPTAHAQSHAGLQEGCGGRRGAQLPHNLRPRGPGWRY